jgi:carbonic anhydrase/acetyltransferase-like protein (isoleucine patch superfamily)
MDARSQSRDVETVGADAVVPPRPTWRGKLCLWRARRRPGVELESGVRLGRDVVLRTEPGARLVIRAGAAVGDGARLEARGGELRVGADAAIGAHASLAGAVTVGRECVIGDWARVEGDAHLEDRSRLAAHAVALAGAHVGEGAVVGSYAVVDGAVAPGTVVRATQTRAPRSSS